jgi:Pyruvate/2-oxoacid:ferredoxin oxidoreductase delta subunit
MLIGKIIMAKRQIITIDQEKCDGCGLCVPSCAEGAIEIVDGKAQLVAEKFCDGLGACLGECPQGALIIEEREADEFVGPAPGSPAALEHGAPEAPAAEEPVFVCPGSQMRQFERRETPEAASSALSHWPVKLRLVSPKAPFLKGAELLVAADCAAFAAGDFHARYLHGRAVVCGCPKFEDLEESAAKLTAILKENDITGITIVNIEVPCCHGLVQVVRQAMIAAGKVLPVSICTLGPTGQVVQQQKIKGK